MHSLNLFVLRLRHCYPVPQNSPLLSGAMWRHVIVQASLQLTLLAITTSAKGSSWMSGAPPGTSAFVHVWGGSGGGGNKLGDAEACSQDVHRNTLTFAVFVACQVREGLIFFLPSCCIFFSTVLLQFILRSCCSILYQEVEKLRHYLNTILVEKEEVDSCNHSNIHRHFLLITATVPSSHLPLPLHYFFFKGV